jgi:hypothetical protein
MGVCMALQLFHAKAIDGLLLLQLNEDLINKGEQPRLQTDFSLYVCALAYDFDLDVLRILPELSIPDTLHRMKLVSHIKGLQATHAQWLIDDEKRRAKVQASITTS